MVMATARTDPSTILGVIAIVLGILILIGWFGFGDLVPILGVVLVVAAILILLGVIAGSRLAAILFLVLGILLLTGFLPGLGVIGRVIDIVVAIVLIIYGIMLVK